MYFLSLCLNLCMERVAKKYVPPCWSVISSISLWYLKVQKKVLWLLHGTCNFKSLISGQCHKHIMKQAAALNHWVPCPCCAELPLATSREPAMVKVPNTVAISLWYEMVKFSSPFFLSFVPIAVVSSHEPYPIFIYPAETLLPGKSIHKTCALIKVVTCKGPGIFQLSAETWGMAQHLWTGLKVSAGLYWSPMKWVPLR